MSTQPVNHYQSIFLVTFAVTFSLLIGLSFIHSPGTSDVEIWQTWANNADTYGPVKGYAATDADYPPLATAILWVANKVFYSLGRGLNIKFSIFFFLILIVFVFWLWTRDLKVTLILYFALLLNSVALGYIDVYFAPAFIFSLWMLEERRWLWFSLSFGVAALIKWQPIIIAPFCSLYILGTQDIRALRQVDYPDLFGKVVVPSVVLAASVGVAFGPMPTLKAFYYALNHAYLSGNALNLNWIVTHFARLES
jgi:Gpi18-like mannosyltransferase